MPDRGVRAPSKFEPSGYAFSHCLDVGRESKDPYVTNRQNNRMPRNGNRRPGQAAQQVVSALPGGGMRVTHTEFCGALNHNTSTPMHNDAISGEHVPAKPLVLPINPGDGATFPWLSGIATRFEKYKFTRIQLKYLPTCSTLENGGTAICPILDPNDPVPQDRHTLMNAQNTMVVPVHRQAMCNFPTAALRKTDTMYIRDKHGDLLDPAELRTTDLGYFAVILTDTNPYQDDTIPRNYGDIFISYTVELTAPRAKPNASKGAYIADPNLTPYAHNVQTIHGALWPETVINDAGPRGLLNDASTLNVEVEHTKDVYKHVDSGKDIEYAAVTFKEPFEGVMEVTNVNTNEQGAINSANIVANGKVLSEHDGTHKWELQTGAKHKHRLCKVKPLRTIRSGLHKVKHTVKVVAQAGETLAMHLNNHGVDLTTWAEVLLSEIPEELLTVLPALAAL